jgi:D-alanine-D-alanine ligase
VVPEARIRLVVLFGGQSAEHDVSCVSARHVLAAVDRSRYIVEPVGITRDGRWVSADAALAALDQGVAALPDALVAEGSPIDALPTLAGSGDEATVVFPVLHGPMGEDGTIQGLLELLGVPYVGAGVLGSALCMDKVKAKELLAHHGIPQARFEAHHADQLPAVDPEALVERLGLPLFVKPANLGSSVGVSKVKDVSGVAPALALAASYDEWIVVEEGIDGREIELSVLGNTAPQVSVPGEILAGAEFYDYEDKYLDGSAELRIPAELPPEVTAELQRLAAAAYTILRAEGLARADFFYEEHGRGILLNELNTMPGFTPISMYPKMWAASGLPYPALIDRLVELALERHDRRNRHRRTARNQRI